MKKIIYTLILVAILIGGFYTFKELNKKTSNNTTEVNMVDYKNATYTINGQNVILKNGVSETEAAPGSASKITTKYVGNEVTKDLNADGRDDVAFLLTQETGGSGTFFYVVAALNTEHGYVGSGAFLLGDRITPQTTESGPGQSIIVNYMVRADGEPMTTQPSVGKSLYLILDTNTMQFGDVGQNVEGEADPSVMNLTMKTWNWIETEYSDDTTVSPKKDAFSLTFKADGTFSATTDCNSFGGKYADKKPGIEFSDVATTLMYCEGSQDSAFMKMVQDSNQYLFTSKGELVLNIKLDSGAVYFR